MGIEKEQIDTNAEQPKRKPGRPVTKVRKERSQAQLASDAKCKERMLKMHESRRQGLNIEEKAEQPGQPQQLPEPDPEPDAVPNSPELEAPSKEQNQEPDIEEDSSSSDEEIIVKRKPKKKKKKKRIIYEESSSESEEEKKPRKPTPPETLEKRQPELKAPALKRSVAEPMPTFTFF